MENNIYSCLKILESLYNRTVNAYNIESWDVAQDLGEEYIRIYNLLEKHLSPEQIEFIPSLDGKTFYEHNYSSKTDFNNAKKAYLTQIATLCDIGVSFLKSLEMNLDKEFAKQKSEVKLKEKELELKEKEIEHMKKLLSKSIEAIKEFPELQRSKIVGEIKEAHRKIEKNTNPDSKSQNN